MKRSFAAAFLAAVLALALTACGTAQQTEPDVTPAPPAVQTAAQRDGQAPDNSPTVQASPNAAADSGTAAPAGDWKAAFEKSLWENYQAVPDHYEDLGDGVYQVYVKIDGKVVPYVAVNSATGDYHG